MTVTTYNYGVETVRAIHPTQGDKALQWRPLGHLIWPDWDTLCVKDRDDPLAEMIAKTIIKIAQTGVH